MTAAFGYAPQRRDLILNDGGDFILSLVLTQGNWPEGADIYFHLGNRKWHAEIRENTAYWKIESQITDEVPDKTPYRLFIVYPPETDGGEATDYVWYYGKVKRTRMT